MGDVSFVLLMLFFDREAEDELVDTECLRVKGSEAFKVIFCAGMKVDAETEVSAE